MNEDHLLNIIFEISIFFDDFPKLYKIGIPSGRSTTSAPRHNHAKPSHTGAGLSQSRDPEKITTSAPLVRNVRSACCGKPQPAALIAMIHAREHFLLPNLKKPEYQIHFSYGEKARHIKNDIIPYFKTYFPFSDPY
ncbi:hypothetical protein OQ252_00520 [Acetobacter farinalis]|uniref:Uncharacterized protein n=1 Tax=Acetobacter farinalis TaxID=1260984 RepID=A0ABT3Q3M5_9PROT|nr:hypothetical protein [Acetobacter farinalis]MCX2559884.1 hypothetical protein [Acetobacter farinalis]NHO28545.1 hypothetical protein [Acetobacter farinalis]